MSRSAWLAGALAALAAGAAGYGVGHDGPALSALAGRVATGLPPALVERARDGFARLLPAAAGPGRARAAAPSGPVVYYQDPDGKPVYSLAPMVTEDGREFRAVHASEDIRFDGAQARTEAVAADPPGHAMSGPDGVAHPMGKGAMADAARADGAPRSAADGRRILYYRNPMGLPDTSPVPKTDSMGMDYIPVYAGEDADGSLSLIHI